MTAQAISKISVDFTKKLGGIKPMNAGNNGPKNPRGDQTSGNFETFKMLRIPYARLHDANLCYAYGAPHTVDIRAIFKDFNADPTDPASYDFYETDRYLENHRKRPEQNHLPPRGSIEQIRDSLPVFHRISGSLGHLRAHHSDNCTASWANGSKKSLWESERGGSDRMILRTKRNWQGSAEEFRRMFLHYGKTSENMFSGTQTRRSRLCAPITLARGPVDGKILCRTGKAHIKLISTAGTVFLQFRIFYKRTRVRSIWTPRTPRRKAF